MITRKQYEDVVERASEMLRQAGIAITPDEKSHFEVADFGLSDLEHTGLEIIVYMNTERCCAKELVMFPGQTCRALPPDDRRRAWQRRDLSLPLGHGVRLHAGRGDAVAGLPASGGFGTLLQGLARSVPEAGRSAHSPPGYDPLVSIRAGRRDCLGVFHKEQG
jgi:hypothetical protein